MTAIDSRLLCELEERLDPVRPEEAGVAIVGYGEISTVLRLPGQHDVICKRMAGFETDDEVAAYCALVEEYCKVLGERGIDVVPTASQPVHSGRNGRVVYLVQPSLPAAAVGNVLLRTMGDDALRNMLHAILDRIGGLWAANRQAPGTQLGLDSQISNWVWMPRAEGEQRLAYLDTGTPLMRREGRELLNPEIGLRAMPPPLAWGVRHFLLRGVMSRYYNLREVLKDLVGNFIKEGCAERMPLALEEVNRWSTDARDGEVGTITEADVRAYYRLDAWIWRIFQACRRVDRFARTRILGRPYLYILPGTIRR